MSSVKHNGLPTSKEIANIVGSAYHVPVELADEDVFKDAVEALDLQRTENNDGSHDLSPKELRAVLSLLVQMALNGDDEAEDLSVLIFEDLEHYAEEP